MSCSPKDYSHDTKLTAASQTNQFQADVLPNFLRIRIDLLLILLSLLTVSWFYLLGIRTIDARLSEAAINATSKPSSTAKSWHTLPVVLSGEVVGEVEYPAVDTSRFLLRVITPGGWENYLVRISALPWEKAYRLLPGDTASFEGTLLCPASKETLGFLMRRNARCYLRAEAVFSYRAAGKELQGRRKLVHELQEVFSDSHALAVLVAMTLGLGDLLGELLSRRFKDTGLAHVLVISGYHVGLVYGAAFVVFLRVLARVTAISSVVAVQAPASLLSLVIAALYTWLCGGELPAVRALIILVVFVLANVCGRFTSSGRNLVLAFLLVQLIWPGSAEQAGCQLTFAALLGIYAVAPAAFAVAKIQSWSRFVRLVLQSALVSLGAWLGTTPVIIWWFEQFVPLSVFFNVLFVFPLSGVFVGGGLFVILAAWLKLPGWEFCTRVVLKLGEELLNLFFVLEEAVREAGLGATTVPAEYSAKLALVSALVPLLLGLSCHKFFAKLR